MKAMYPTSGVWRSVASRLLASSLCSLLVTQMAVSDTNGVPLEPAAPQVPGNLPQLLFAWSVPAMARKEESADGGLHYTVTGVRTKLACLRLLTKELKEQGLASGSYAPIPSDIDTSLAFQTLARGGVPEKKVYVDLDVKASDLADCGMWRFKREDGTSASGWLAHQDSLQTDSKLLSRLTGGRSGELSCQLEAESVGGSRFSAGRIELGRRHGPWTWLGADGSVSIVNYDQGREQGRSMWWSGQEGRPSAARCGVLDYRNGEPDGLGVWWDNLGRVTSIVSWQEGRRHGLSAAFDEQLRVRSIEYYDWDELKAKWQLVVDASITTVPICVPSIGHTGVNETIGNLQTIRRRE